MKGTFLMRIAGEEVGRLIVIFCLINFFTNLARVLDNRIICPPHPLIWTKIAKVCARGEAAENV